ncbi:hypothetical protein COS55_02355 [Candidatus Shapirobacteria bacterium CG03_land_8_20_14_0_80_40_19]|uniref:Uncharacterized protein n=4 Tax=Candidatus Shapironibacteriota TaxID=1752721 RepID=A0A2M7BDN6_9BACT|nr:MAG: hypothetical protein COV89_02275 [Candidatus Shapirobacteria bacterium CG11_big_fil_rev_8_21_14_0_20_40_12]PIV01218.1 MAG: hypothetical protein COS55_02355 [Candidatus Shapirobacteria bacterium CG03_land_8_20_14_0_80_40_19]PJC28588.1 MAG: hypothetical protein CO053_03865 [Candidatus Shapirobacteria bacterium CG_4_9_14_0_2_um_filter_40_11]PJC77535.1 MAG: hypothetical protein CO010_00320 [Candidatus Shapirobacteria bacterium CG_4_8_14_3_um_filter_39_11]
MLLHNEILSHLIVTLIYFVLVSVLRWQLNWDLLGLWLGAFLGTFFLDIDHLIYWFITNPEKSDSIEAKKGKIKDWLRILKENHTSHTRLVFHSAVGQAVLLVLAFYLLTSGGSIFGSAFIVSINLHLLKDEWFDFQKDKVHLADWLFWQIRGFSAEKHLAIYLIITNVLFLILTGLLI